MRNPRAPSLGQHMTRLAGKQILIVEDEFFIPETAADMLSALGATVVGPAATVAQALSIIEREPIDAALLDVNLNGERSEAVARALEAKGAPFVIATGYGASGWRGVTTPILNKPYSQDDLRVQLETVLAAAAEL